MKSLGQLARRVLRRMIPNFVLYKRRKRMISASIARVDKELAGKSVSEVFSEIYRRHLWGKPTIDRQFSSGHGSTMDLHVAPYVAAVGKLVKELNWKPSVVDLGCGDFNVGSRTRAHFGNYVACDVAIEVLEENRVRFAGLGVDFCQVDIVCDDLPEGDVCIIRQVLQHLSNSDISRVINKLAKFQIVIVTELLPKGDFIPNLDQPTGVSSRIARGIPSGVVLTEPPFSLPIKSRQVICVTHDDLSDAKLVTEAMWL